MSVFIMARRSTQPAYNRTPAKHNAGVIGRLRKGTVGKRARAAGGRSRDSYLPPETWHDPAQRGGKYKVIAQTPGLGYRHVLTIDDVRAKLAELPSWMTKPLQVVQLSRMTRKKRTFPCYGMQWGSSIYLYPLEEDRVEHFGNPPKPAQLIEAKMYGARWELADGSWRLVWTEDALRDFYLNNILMHEIGHLLDQRNTSYADRERYAEWFALEHGYKKSRDRKALATAAADAFCPPG